MVLTSCNLFLSKCGRCEYSFKGNSEKSVKMVMRLHRKKCEATSADDPEIQFKTTPFTQEYHKATKQSMRDYNHNKHDWESFSKEWTTSNSNCEKEIEKVNTRNGLVK